MSKSIVLKVGGSLIYNSSLELNNPFIVKFINWFEKAKTQYDHIVIIVGGGTVSRHLVDQIKPYSVSEMYMHRIGMEITTTNAIMLAASIKNDDVFVPRTLGKALEAVIGDKVRVIISGGFKPGWSTDMDAAVMADVLGVDRVYKLSNIDFVYTDDPSKNLDAKPIKDISWSRYFNQFGISIENPHHEPGGHLPVGHFASQFAARKGISFFISGGKTLDKASDLGTVFESGTFIHS